jgi:nuclear pore complex protein Nup133
LVNTSSSSDTGLLLVYPGTGKITYWENVETAETTGLLGRRKAVDGGIKLMGGGEYVEALVDLEHAGYILKLSSGRLAHLTVRDSQGRAAINTTQLSSDGQAKGGFLGSLYQSVVGWRNTIAAVAARPSTARAHMEVIAVTNEGAFKIWDVDWTGTNTFLAQYDASKEIREALVAASVAEANSKANIKVVDFAIIHGQGDQVSPRGASRSGLNILVLVAVEDVPTTRFALLQLTLAGGSHIQLQRTIPIHVYSATSAKETSGVKLLVPKPEHTAFVVSANIVAVASLSTTSPTPFQDVIYFHADKGAEIVSSRIEAPTSSKTESSSILLFTKISGAVRVSANSPSRDAAIRKVTAKSKVEQAIFFGSLPDNIIDLAEISVFAFPSHVLEAAAMQISSEILKSTSPFIPTLSSSMVQQMNIRAKAFRDLILFMKRQCSPLSKSAKWQLMWDAERLECGREIWKVYEKWLKEQTPTDLAETLLDLAVFLTKETDEPDSDLTREWFTHDLDAITSMLTRIPRSVQEQREAAGLNTVELLSYFQEAEDIYLAALETPYRFREDHAALYGLEGEELVDGVLMSGYADLKTEVWTGRANTVTGLQTTIEAFRLAYLRIAANPKSVEVEKGIHNLIMRQWRLIDLSCKAHTERYLWLQSRSDPAEKARGDQDRKEFEEKIRYNHLMGLADFNRARDGLKIAEKAKDIRSLVGLCLTEIEFHSATGPLAQVSVRRSNSEKQLKQIENDVRRYFKTFGERFALAFYVGEFRLHKYEQLLKDNPGEQRQLTAFLRGDAEEDEMEKAKVKLDRGKLSWINEITKEKNPLEAGKALMQVAEKKESSIWAQKAQLAIAKLAFLGVKKPAAVGTEKSSEQQEQEDEAIRLLDLNNGKIFVSKTQERVRNYFEEDIASSLDPSAAVGNLIEGYGKHATKDRPYLQELLGQDFTALYNFQVLSPDDLIDLLTLVDTLPEKTDVENLVAGQEFLLALKVLHYSRYCDEEDPEFGQMLLRLIWKRLFIRDDWKAVNNTKGKTDADTQKVLRNTVLFKTLKLGYEECKLSLFPV